MMDIPIVLKTASFGGLTDDQLFDFCQENRELRIERTKTGEIIIMPPTGGETGLNNFNIAGQLYIWNHKEKKGVAFDSSTGFHLPSGAVRSTDVAWVSLERWQALSPDERKKFPPLCPDFVIELRSATDSLGLLQDKMIEWISNGCRLAWLIDTEHEDVYIYRPEANTQKISSFNQVFSGEDVLPGFNLDLNLLR